MVKMRKNRLSGSSLFPFLVYHRAMKEIKRKSNMMRAMRIIE